MLNQHRQSQTLADLESHFPTRLIDLPPTLLNQKVTPPERIKKDVIILAISLTKSVFNSNKT